MRSAPRMCYGWATPHCWHVQVVASAASDAASRMAIFATINSVSAIVIAGLQLFATGFLLTRLKLPTALAASAVFAAGLMSVIAVHPSPVVVGGGEVIRKVCTREPLQLLVFTWREHSCLMTSERRMTCGCHVHQKGLKAAYLMPLLHVHYLACR